MKKVCIFGGTFNPPHIGHLIMANEVYHALDFDEIRFMPNAKPPHKEATQLATGEQRLHMLELAVEPFSYFTVESLEIVRGGLSYSFDTMMELQKQEPQTQFSFLIGADMIAYLDQWYKIDELVKHIQLIGVRRPGYDDKSAYPVTIIDAPLIDLSSTMLRNRLQQGKDVSLLIPESVQSYIRQEKLYE
ncbi:nicotinate-nucleotide adenylyltransferase [Paenisporosarcina macmurdoensis]|uniref:Probable nicotinate-nucleotide adenylyltransferase n=1 Tax=Paenisporosarcina macmurdoensis TaxID=212659 RepID=A0ABW1L9A5_9BACL